MVLLVWLVAFLAKSGLSADILALHPFPSYSHVMPFLPIYRQLGLRGHNVTFISSRMDSSNPPGLRQIHVNTSNDELRVLMESLGRESPHVSSAITLGSIRYQLEGIGMVCDAVTPYMLERLKPHLPPRGTKFDLVFIEPFFCMESLAAASVLYNAPLVATIPVPLTPLAALASGNPIGWAYVPNQRTSFSARMTFLERVWNTLANGGELLMNYLVHLPYQDRLMREILEEPDLPYVGDLLKNISFILTETHFSVGHPRPYVRNVVEVGGSFAKADQPLSEELEKFMSKAKKGVIYFSWGSHFQAKGAENILAGLMEGFSRMQDIRVLFTWYQDIPNPPPNVRIQNWFPQKTILAHNKTVLFVSHGGLNSMQEAAYHGVPVLGTPLFGDQPHNLEVLRSLGMAVVVRPESLADPAFFKATMDRMINDPSLREKAQRTSQRLRDQPLGAVEEAVFWVEHILRHGAGHLQPASKDLPWYSLAILDVVLFILAGLILFLYAIVASCLRLCRRKTTKKATPKKKKQ